MKTLKEKIEYFGQEMRDWMSRFDIQLQSLLIAAQKNGLGPGNNNVDITENFNLKEWQCPCCGAVKIYIPVAEKLEKLRTELGGRPIRIGRGGGYRCRSYNEEIGGAKKSQHPLGRAVDVSVDGCTPEEVAAAAEKVGFVGIGIYTNRGFTHLDLREGGAARWTNLQTKEEANARNT